MQEITLLALAFVLGLAASRFGLPVFVGYLCAGFLAGNFGGGVTPLIEEASHVGVLFLLFTVGLHLNLRTILTREVLVGGAGHMLLSTTIFVVACRFFDLDWQTAIFLGVLLSMSSTVITAKDLENRNELSAFHGRIAIGILILQDLVAVLLFAMVGERTPAPLSLVAIPALIAARPLLGWLVRVTRNPDLLLLLGTLLALGFAEFFHALRLSPELGALLAGALLAGHPRAETLADRTWALKEIFLVGFFIKVGMVGTLGPDTLFWAGLILLVLPLKAAFFFGLLVLLGLRARTAFITGATLTSYSEFTLVGGLVGYNQGLLTADYFAVLAVATAASFMINLPVNRLVHAIYNRIANVLVPLQLDVRHPDQPAPLQESHDLRFLVLGLGRTGGAALRWLEDNNYPVAGIDSDPLVAQEWRGQGIDVICADVQDSDLWSGISVDRLEGVVIALPGFGARLEAVRRVREAGDTTKISVYAMNPQEEEKLRAAGATEISRVLEDAGVRLAELSL